MAASNVEPLSEVMRPRSNLAAALLRCADGSANGSRRVFVHCRCVTFLFGKTWRRHTSFCFSSEAYLKSDSNSLAAVE
jgi:hypothetical protein